MYEREVNFASVKYILKLNIILTQYEDEKECTKLGLALKYVHTGREVEEKQIFPV